jgi:hypothetical protein
MIDDALRRAERCLSLSIAETHISAGRAAHAHMTAEGPSTDVPPTLLSTLQATLIPDDIAPSSLRPHPFGKTDQSGCLRETRIAEMHEECVALCLGLTQEPAVHRKCHRDKSTAAAAGAKVQVIKLKAER